MKGLVLFLVCLLSALSVYSQTRMSVQLDNAAFMMFDNLDNSKSDYKNLENFRVIGRSIILRKVRSLQYCRPLLIRPCLSFALMREDVPPEKFGCYDTEYYEAILQSYLDGDENTLE